MSSNILEEKSIEQTVKEIGFNLSLPAQVEGQDMEGNFFNEKTSLSYISHQGSSFWIIYLFSNLMETRCLGI